MTTAAGFDPETGLCCGHVTACSSSLNIRRWTPLARGGHSFLFRILLADDRDGAESESVLKIFRFASPARPRAAPVSPYAYFSREADAYTLLSSVPVAAFTPTRAPVPCLLGFLRLSREHETQLLSAQQLRGFAPAHHRVCGRASQAEMPLLAVRMEYVRGRRLAREDTGACRMLLRDAVEWVHRRGVVQGDVNWRNALVVEKGEGEKGEDMGKEESGDDARRRGVVLVDFSNARTRAGFGSEGEWQQAVARERKRVCAMLDIPPEEWHGEITGADMHGRGEAPEEVVETKAQEVEDEDDRIVEIL